LPPPPSPTPERPSPPAPNDLPISSPHMLPRADIGSEPHGDTDGAEDEPSLEAPSSPIMPKFSRPCADDATAPLDTAAGSDASTRSIAARTPVSTNMRSF